MDILDNYLDTMFSGYPLTPQTQEAKRELRAMMEDAYNGAVAAGHSQNEAIGQAIAEFGNIEEVAPILGLSSTEPTFIPATQTDEDPVASPLPVEPQSSAAGTVPQSSWAPPAAASPAPSQHRITLTQAQNYADTMKQTRWMLGGGVALIILGAAPFVGLATAFGDNTGSQSTMSMVGGFALLLPLVGAGVGLLIYRSSLLSPFRRITAGTDYCPPEVEAYATVIRNQNSGARTRSLVIAVVLWILSGFPVIATGVLTQDWAQNAANPILGTGLASTLLLVAIGLLIFLPNNWAESAATKLLKTSPNSIAMERAESDMDRYPAGIRAVFAGYWPVITAIYLAWSFISGAWDSTWIIWPVSAVAFGAFAAIVGSVYSSNNRRDQ